MKYLIIAVLATSALGFSVQPSLKDSMERGKVVYSTYCLTCHQEDGKGVQRMHPPLTSTEFVRGDKKRLIGIVLNGLQGEIEVEGDMYNNLMAAQDFLTNEQIADVLTYVRNSFGNKYSLITPAEVKTVRASKKNK